MSSARRGGDRALPMSARRAPGALRLDLVQAFIAVSEELHFTRAAGRLFMSQSGLSRRISLLEQMLGAALIVRTTRSVYLTPAGLALLPYAEEMLRAADAGAAASHSACRDLLTVEPHLYGRTPAAAP